jgi:hypothetical protein
MQRKIVSMVMALAVITTSFSGFLFSVSKVSAGRAERRDRANHPHVLNEPRKKSPLRQIKF